MIKKQSRSEALNATAKVIKRWKPQENKDIDIIWFEYTTPPWIKENTGALGLSK